MPARRSFCFAAHRFPALAGKRCACPWAKAPAWPCFPAHFTDSRRSVSFLPIESSSRSAPPRAQPYPSSPHWFTASAAPRTPAHSSKPHRNHISNGIHSRIHRNPTTPNTGRHSKSRAKNRCRTPQPRPPFCLTILCILCYNNHVAAECMQPHPGIISNRGIAQLIAHRIWEHRCIYTSRKRKPPKALQPCGFRAVWKTKNSGQKCVRPQIWPHTRPQLNIYRDVAKFGIAPDLGSGDFAGSNPVIPTIIVNIRWYKEVISLRGDFFCLR